MTNYKEAILLMVDSKEKRKRELLTISKKLIEVMDITNDDVQLIRHHDVGFNFPSLGLSIQSAVFAWNDWQAILVIRPIGSVDHPPLQWTYIPDDEVLEGLVKEIIPERKKPPVGG